LKIDLHLHTADFSACSHAPAEVMICAAIGFGLDAVCLTEHDRLWPEAVLAEMNARFAPFRVFGGIEIGVTPLEHCLVLGVRDPEIETRVWTYPDLARFVRERDGFLAVCHPFRFEDSIPFEIDEFPPDAIELRSVHTSPDDEERIREAAERVGARLLCNSDAHYAQYVGIYHNELTRAPVDERDLVGMLKAGEYKCRSDEARLREMASTMGPRASGEATTE